jgi:hypothetical protein
VQHKHTMRGATKLQLSLLFSGVVCNFRWIRRPSTPIHCFLLIFRW